MLPFADVMHFFADKFSGLRRGRFTFASIFVGSLQSFTFGHGIGSF